MAAQPTVSPTSGSSHAPSYPPPLPLLAAIVLTQRPPGRITPDSRRSFQSLKVQSMRVPRWRRSDNTNG